MSACICGRSSTRKWSGRYMVTVGLSEPNESELLTRSKRGPAPCGARGNPTPVYALMRPRSHRRRYPVPTDPPGATLQRSVGLLVRDDEDFRAGLEITLVARY